MRISMATNIPFEFFGEEEGLRLLKETGFDTADYSLYIPGTFERLLSSNIATQRGLAPVAHGGPERHGWCNSIVPHLKI